MNKLLVVTTSSFGLTAVQGPAARADDALDRLAKDPKQWVTQQGDDANTRFSTARTRSTRRTSRNCRSPGRSRPVFCAVMKAARW